MCFVPQWRSCTNVLCYSLTVVHECVLSHSDGRARTRSVSQRPSGVIRFCPKATALGECVHLHNDPRMCVNVFSIQKVTATLRCKHVCLIVPTVGVWMYFLQWATETPKCKHVSLSVRGCLLPSRLQRFSSVKKPVSHEPLWVKNNVFYVPQHFSAHRCHVEHSKLPSIIHS